jgi:hypothetical protein
VWQRAACRRASRQGCGRHYVDNGSAFSSKQLLRALASLGIALVHSRPRKPERRGKIERFIEAVRLQFPVEIEANVPSDLLELNRRFGAWVETAYHRRVHSETNEAPIDRVLASGPPALPTPEKLHEALLWSETRQVTKTATISLHSNTFEVDAALVGARVRGSGCSPTPTWTPMRPPPASSSANPPFAAGSNSAPSPPWTSGSACATR